MPLKRLLFALFLALLLVSPLSAACEEAAVSAGLGDVYGLYLPTEGPLPLTFDLKAEACGGASPYATVTGESMDIVEAASLTLTADHQLIIDVTLNTPHPPPALYLTNQYPGFSCLYIVPSWDAVVPADTEDPSHFHLETAWRQPWMSAIRFCAHSGEDVLRFGFHEGELFEFQYLPPAREIFNLKVISDIAVDAACVGGDGESVLSSGTLEITPDGMMILDLAFASDPPLELFLTNQWEGSNTLDPWSVTLLPQPGDPASFRLETPWDAERMSYIEFHGIYKEVSPPYARYSVQRFDFSYQSLYVDPRLGF